MNKNKRAFTLVEMLFVVMIAAMALTFTAYKLKNAKNQGVDKAATGFLMDLANATEAMRRDLAREVNLLGALKVNALGGNIKVTPAGGTASASDTQGKTLYNYLNSNSFSKTSFINALSAYGYMHFGIASPGTYTYYVNIGYDIPGSCGTLVVPDGLRVVAYMCKTETGATTSPKGWAYLNDGTIRQLD